MRYRPDIDGLRAVAVLAVVFFHAKLPSFGGGFVGVDVFFVISGYLITGLIADDCRNGRFTFADFYFRRIRRIVPALVCVYAACALLAALFMLPSDMAEFGRSLRSSAMFVSNHFFYRLADYFGGQSDLKPLLHTWSLSIEEQFYLVWPAVFLLLVRWRKDWLHYVIAAVGALSLAASVAMVGQHREAAFFLAPFRAWELLLGSWLALLPPRQALSSRTAEIYAGVGLALIVGSTLLLGEGDPFPGLLAIPPCLGAGLLIRAGMETQPPLVTRLLSMRPAVAVGLVSYSLYLWHWPLLAFARYHFDRPLLWSETALLLVAGLLLSVATYRWVERPARRLQPARMRQVLGVGVLSLAAVGLAGYRIDKDRGWTFNISPQIRQLDAAARSENPYRRACSGPANITRDDEACTFGHPRQGGSYDMAIFGDSHADHYAPAMRVLAEQAGMSGRQITVGGCLALVGYYEIISPYATEARCRSLRDAMVRFVEQNPHMRVAVLAQHWSVYTGKVIYEEEGQHAFYVTGTKQDERSPQRSLDVLQESLERSIDLFEKKGVHVLLLGEIPPLKHEPTKCVAASIARGADLAACRRAAAEVKERIGKMNDLLADLARRRKNVSFFSPLPWMCRGGWCSPVVDGVYMYRDRGHLNRVGSEHLARWLRLPQAPPRS